MFFCFLFGFFFPSPPLDTDIRFWGFQEVAGVRIGGFTNPTDVRKTPRPPKAAEKIWPFFLFKIKISVGIFFDLSGSEIFDISEFHGCKIWSIFKSGGCKF